MKRKHNINSILTIKLIIITIFLLLFTQCKKSPTTPILPIPELTTIEVSAITDSTAVSGGNITSDGGATVTARGVCWGTTQTPTISDNKTTDGDGAGAFTSKITGLTPETKYYVRAYATNSAGTGYGSAMTFTTHEVLSGTITDIDGNVYQTVKIDAQWWMAENLKVSHYQNGDAIPNVTGGSDWSNLSTGAYCAYNNDNSNIATYGLLYNWYTVNDSRGLAPDGWHVPTDDEWKQLEMYLGMSQSEAYDSGWRGTDEGSKLKSTNGWYDDGNGTNESGFSALPGGYRYLNGTFHYIGKSGNWWSSTELSSNYAWHRYLRYDYSDINRNTNYEQIGFSVRCVKD